MRAEDFPKIKYIQHIHHYVPSYHYPVFCMSHTFHQYFSICEICGRVRLDWHGLRSM